MESVSQLLERLGTQSILVDARKIKDGGIGVYTQNLIADLVRCGIPLTLLGRTQVISEFAWKSKVQVIEEDAKSYSADELFSLGKRIDFKRFALFHTPHYMLPFGLAIPTVVTVHDLIHLTHPEHFYYPAVAWPLIAATLWRANAVVTVSRAAERDLRRFFPLLTGAKLHVIPNRLPDTFIENQSTTNQVKGDFFFVSVSQPKPHKGILDLLHAWVRAKAERNDHTELLIGGYGAAQLATLPGYQDLLAQRQDVRIIGALDGVALKNCYAQARAVIVPSRAEGFGLPLLEAHALGTPVIFRPVPALLELQAATDVVAADFSISALAHAIGQMLQRRYPAPDQDRISLQQAAMRYSGQQIIEPMLSLYLRILGD